MTRKTKIAKKTENPIGKFENIVKVMTSHQKNFVLNNKKHNQASM